MSSPSEPKTPVGVLLSDDLLFTSRIAGVARDLGLLVRPARSLETLTTLLQEQNPSCIIVDLAHPGLCITDLMEHLRTSSTAMPRVVAYGSHVDTATLRAAKEAGCAVVLPRSKFVEELPRAMAEWMAPSN
jgi:CheY-like chemotaxis protein